ncbi:MAG TPA: PA14 domain-containing protein, partial [Tepidisphaeraceae bacterium]|nr:PA14 domain-containing protein [Tepidisphaeraceae bacterium]
MSLRNGRKTSRTVARADRESALRLACHPVAGEQISKWETLEHRVLFSHTTDPLPLIHYSFDTPPEAGDQVLNSGTGGAAYNGTLVASPDFTDPAGVPGEKPTRVEESANPSPPTFVDDRLFFNGQPNSASGSPFRGSGGRVDSATQLQDILGRNATVSAWINTTQVGHADFWQSPAIAASEFPANPDVFYGYLLPDGNIGVRAGDNGAAASTTPVNDGSWHHVAFTRDMVSGEVAVYVDGNLQDTALSETGFKNARITSIGATTVVTNQNVVEGYNHWNGDLDEVMIFDRVLTPHEVSRLYNTQSDTDVPTTPVTTPTGVTATATSPSTIDIAFTDASNNETAFEVFRGTTNNPAQAVLFRRWQRDVTDPPSATITITNGGLTPATQYFYFVRAVNAGVEGAFAPAASATTGALPTRVVPAGTGAYAEFYDLGSNAEQYFNDPGLTRVDAQIATDYGGGTPGDPIGVDNHTGRWTGKLQIPTDFDGDGTPGESVPVTFVSATDDGAYLWIAGEQVINDPTYHGIVNRTADRVITLQEGGTYNYQYQFFEGGGGSGAFLRWFRNGVIENVPASAFVNTQRGAVPAPLNLRGTNVDADQATIVWDNETSQAQAWFITVTNRTTGAQQSITTDPDGSPFTVTGLSPNTTYDVAVRGYNPEGGMSPTSTASFTTGAAPGLAIAAPTITRFMPRTGATQVIFTDNSFNENAFVIERSTNGGAFAEVGRLASSNAGQTTGVGGTVTFTDTTTTAGQNVVYRVVAVGTNNRTSAASNTVGATLGPAGTGLIARHYETRFFDDNPDNDTDPHVRNDSTLDQNWGSGGPAFLVADPSSADPDDTWSAIWDGQIVPEFSETYTFFTASDDGIDIRIIDPVTGQTVLQGPTNGIQFLRGIGFPFQDTVGSVPLQAGKAYDIRVRWSENGGGAAWRVAWQSPSVPFEPIPEAVLFEPSATAAPTGSRTLVARPSAANQVTLRWEDISNNETGWVIERRTGAGAFAPLTTIGAFQHTGGGQFEDIATYVDNTAVNGQSYTYRVRPINGAVPGPNSNEATVTAGGSGGVGLVASIYDTRFFEDNPENPSDPQVRNDVDLDENWGDLGPDYLVADPGNADPDDTWSQVWNGQLIVDKTEPYTFYTGSDDGIDVTITDPVTGNVVLTGPPDGIQFLRGIAYPFQDTVGSATLEAGKAYDIQVRWSENGGGAAWRVAWSSPSFPVEPIPDLYLHETRTNVRPVANLQAPAALPSRINLTWTDNNQSETGFVVQHSTSATGPWTDVGTVRANWSEFSHVGTFPIGSTQYYRVVSNGPGGPVNSAPLAVVIRDPATPGTTLQLNGTAQFVSVPASVDPDQQALRLTDNVNSQTGTAFLRDPMTLDRDFNTTFRFYIPERSGNPADGFALVMQANSPRAVGGGGGSIGYQGIGNSLGLKFDIYNNINQTGIYVNGEGVADDGSDIGFEIDNGRVYEVSVTVDSNSVDSDGDGVVTAADVNDAIVVRITDTTDPAITFEQRYEGDHQSLPFDISALLGGATTPSPYGFLGFTGATGGENAEQVITDWTVAGVEIPLFGGVTPSPVTGVFVSGTGWSADFLAELAEENLGGTLGYRIQPGAAGEDELPWSNINKVSFQFGGNSPVTVAQDDLAWVSGRNIPYAATTFAYDPATRVATWTFNRSFADFTSTNRQTADKINFALDGDAGGANIAGGDYRFRLNVVPGDANRNGNVSPTDYGSVRSGIGRNTLDEGTAPTNYTVFKDINANGNVSPTDIGVVRGNTGANITN